jgi:hypothetical protein
MSQVQHPRDGTVTLAMSSGFIILEKVSFMTTPLRSLPNWQDYEGAKAHFVASHQNPINQAIHHGTNLLAFLSILFLLIDWRIALAMLIAPQPFVWMGHAVFEKNQPAFVKYPGITILASLAWSIEEWFGLKPLLHRA